MEHINDLMLKAKEINKKISIKMIIAMSISMFVILSVVFCVHNTVVNLFLYLLIVAVILVSMIYGVNQKRKILIYDMDPRLYYAVIHANVNEYFGRENDIEVFYFSGDYKNAIYCANALIAKRQQKNKKYSNISILTLLCFSYFEAKDYENAERTIEYIKSLFENYKVKEKSVYCKIILPQLDYIENFINCNFSKCLEIEELLNSDFKKSNTYIARIKYYSALAKYYYGDVKGAENGFKEILSFCPKMNYANLAVQFLNAIQCGKILTLPELDTTFKYSQNVKLADNKKRTKYKMVSFITLLIALLSLFVSLVIFDVTDDYDTEPDYSFSYEYNQSNINNILQE